ISKRPFSERIAWVDENLDMIRKAAANPIETYDWWGQAGKKKKYQFLAACIELSEALRLERPEEFVSYLRIAFDASASGIQHLCAMSRADEGALGNLTPNDIPQDVYQTVYDLVTSKIEELHENLPLIEPTSRGIKGAAHVARVGVIKHFFDRDTLKSVVMTRFYNSEPWGMAQQIINKRERDGW